MHLRIAMALLLVAFLPNVRGAGSKDDKASVSFHLQAEDADNPKMIFPMIIDQRRFLFRRMPEFRLNDFAGYKAFPSKKNPQNFDVVMRLKPHAAKRLQLITNANRGLWMAAQLNGRACGVVTINEQVNDGVLVIWGHATLADIATLEHAFPKPKKRK